MTRAMPFLRAVGSILVALLSQSAFGQELRIGLRGETSSLDPQFQNQAANNQIAAHLFDTLVMRDERQQLVPGLALSWKPDGDTVWEFKLRPGVAFHDGSPFTARDVAFTFERAARVPNSPTPFTSVTRQVTKLEIVDPLTLRLTTAMPAPLLPLDLAGLAILSAKAAGGGAPEGRTTAELDRGEGLVGTGPFKFVAWKRGGVLSLARNDAYWGPKPAFAAVTLKPYAAAARVAALLAGEVDLIEDPGASELGRLRRQPKLALVEAVTGRLIFIALDAFAEPSPGIPDTQGKNPLKDRRVRLALARAIDRRALVDKATEGQGQPAADLVPRGIAPAERFDASGARKLLAEAGYANGFSLTIGTANGRFPNDLKVAQAVAAMWTKIGIKTEVEASTPTAFFKNRDEYRYSAYLGGWVGDSGELSGPLRALLATPSREKGMGGANRGRYANPAVDTKLEEAMRTVDDKKREALLQEASRLALADAGLLPLYFEIAVWAMRRDLAYVGRADQATLAQFVRPRAATR